MNAAQLVQCRSCGATNRVLFERINQQVKSVCGRCKTPLSLSNEPLTVTDINFVDTVELSPLPVLLDLWADWCGPCHMIAPTVKELAGELAGRIVVAKLNVDENPRTAARFSVRSIPTLLLLKKGQEIDRIVGVQPKSEILRRLSINSLSIQS